MPPPDYSLERQRIAAGTKRIGDTVATVVKTSIHDQFLDAMTPMARKRAADALDRSVLNKGMPITRRDLVQRKVNEGSVVVLSKGGDRRLSGVDGSYLAESQISKTAMDYAEYLVGEKKEGNTMAGKSPYTVFIGKCLRQELPKVQQDQAGFSKDTPQPKKMKACALVWKKVKE